MYKFVVHNDNAAYCSHHVIRPLIAAARVHYALSACYRIHYTWSPVIVNNIIIHTQLHMCMIAIVTYDQALPQLTQLKQHFDEASARHVELMPTATQNQLVDAIKHAVGVFCNSLLHIVALSVTNVLVAYPVFY